MKLQKSLPIIGLSLIAIAMVGGTSAYFVTVERTRNVISTSGIAVEIIETSVDGNGQEIPFQNIENALPGATYSKIPQVKNTDDGSAWVRIGISSTATSSTGESLSVPTDLFMIDYNTSDWRKIGNYYYFNSALEAHETTPPLFTEVKINDNLDSAHTSATFNLTLTAEAVQTANNGSTPEEAGGWND